ncbi:MAG: hypothetical protein K9M81_01905 [Chthoniobacterales bacterium]|nr:hypothetical protein [Chthoniobacterales bacterium]
MGTPTSIPQASSSLPQSSSTATPQAAKNDGSTHSAAVVSIPSTIESLSTLTLEKAPTSQGPNSNTLATSLGADPQLESPSSMSPASYQQAISTMLDSLCENPNPDSTDDGQTVTDSSSSATSSEASSTSATDETSSTSGASSTSTTPNYVSMTEIMSEVENLAVKESGNQEAQQNAYLSETNAMVNTAIQGAQDLIDSGAALLTAAIVGLVCTVVGSAAALGIGGYSMKGSADAEGSGENAISHEDSINESGEDSGNIEMTSMKSKETEASTVEKGSESPTAEKTAATADKEKTEGTTDKSAGKKTATPRLDSMMASQYMQMASSLGDAAGKVGSASFQAQSTVDQANSQKAQALVDNYNNAAGMCNSNIQMTASQVQALDTTASSVAQAEAQMVSATSRY